MIIGSTVATVHHFKLKLADFKFTKSQTPVFMLKMTNSVTCLFVVTVYMHLTVQREVLHIIPSATSHCSKTPCLTLLQLAERFNRQSHSESMQLFFLPGDHSLNLDFEISNMSELFMTSNSSRIVCQPNTSFNFHEIGHISIKGFDFLGCSSNKIVSSYQLEVVSSLFLGHNESGTALELIDTNARIINCTFAYNTRGNLRGPIQTLNFLKQWYKFNSLSVYAYVGGAMIVDRSNIAIVCSIFEGNRAEMGGAIFATSRSNITVFNSSFTNNGDYWNCLLGGALHSESDAPYNKTNANIIGSEFFKNKATYFGGAISTYNCDVSAESARFYKNFAILKGGAIEAIVQSKVHAHNCIFWDNEVFKYGAVIGLFNSTLVINTSLFHANSVRDYAGALYVEEFSVVNISRSGFYANEAKSGGAMIVRSNSSAVVHETVFCNNYATTNGGSIVVILANLTLRRCLLCNSRARNRGGAIDANENTSLKIYESEFRNNFAIDLGGGAINAEYTSGVIIIARCRFIQNSVSDGIGGALLVSSSELIIDNCSFLQNVVLKAAGGAIAATQSSMHFRSTSDLFNNTASYGGAIYAIDSTIDVNRNVMIMLNSAFVLGGGALLQYSKLTIQYNALLDVINNNASTKGGGIYSTNSRITVLLNRESDLDSIKGSAISFTNNSAKFGGGIYLELASELFIDKIGLFRNQSTTAKRCNFCFISNHASLGGAIYIADETNYETCSSTSRWSHYCFLQSLSPYPSPCASSSDTEECKYVSVYFEQNTAAVSGGPVLYGGLLDRCIVRPGSEFEVHNKLIDGFTAFKLLIEIVNVSNSQIDTVISSSPVRICSCTPDGRPDCGNKAPPIMVKKGFNFNVSIVAVDQVNHTVGNVPIHSSLQYTQSGLGDGQLIQMTKHNCTNLTFSIHSPHNSESLTLFAEGPCRNTSSSSLKVDIKFSACSCPTGFQAKVSEVTSCVCECDSNLPKYITDCNPHDHTLLRKSNFWITSLAVGNNISSGYLSYPYCPFDYCLHPDSHVYIDLNIANGSDIQCANNRSGILCGSCRPGFSLSLGSSHCIPCSKTWRTDLAAVLVASVLAGVLLVALVLVLNLTVATGTLNGILFYANVVDSNSNMYFSSSLTKFLFVFISWLNLEIGLDVCFHDSLNMYWKTWLQLAFPTYIITLVLAIIVLSRRSIAFSMLIAKKNPVATLATLVLLSYSKLLRTIISALSMAKLKLPNGYYENVWLADATVKYLQGKHIALFIVATMILIVGAFYTFLLLFWQWLLKCVKYQKLCHFLEPYHAPYIFKHRYWTGLLLLVRIAIYLAMVLNGSGDPSMNLLMIIIATSVLLFLKGHIGRIYKSKITDMIETVCYLNVLLLSAAKLFLLEARKDDAIPSFISGLFTLLLFLYILAYHAFTELCLKQCKKLKQSRHMQGVISYNTIPESDDSQ